MSGSRALKWVRIKVRRFGMSNESDRSMNWFHRRYPTVDAKISAILSREAVPLNRYRQPIPIQEAIDGLQEQADPSLPYTFGQSGQLSVNSDAFDAIDVSSVAEDRDRLRTENLQLRQLLRDAMRQGDRSGEIRALGSTEDRGRRIYLSSSRIDLDETDRLHAALEAAGHAVWREEMILEDEDSNPISLRELSDSDALLLVLSRDGIEQDMTLRGQSELDRVLRLHRQRGAHGRTLIPVRLDDCSIPPIPLDGSRTLVDFGPVDLFPAARWSQGVLALLRRLANSSARPLR